MVRFSCTQPFCSACGEQCPRNECPASPLRCGHHCNHSWSHEICCWCGATWEGIDEHSEISEPEDQESGG